MKRILALFGTQSDVRNGTAKPWFISLLDDGELRIEPANLKGGDEPVYEIEEESR